MTDAKNEAARAARKVTHSKLLTAEDVSPTLRARLAKLANLHGPDKCWIWTGKIVGKGYGLWRDERKGKGRYYLVHRASFALANGATTPGLIVRHSCDTPACCNPAHLLEGTWADNNADMVERGRTGWVKLTKDERLARNSHFRSEVHPNNKRVAGPDGRQWPSAVMAARALGEPEHRINRQCRRRENGWSYIA